jgi:BirA family transcriptional regulator, biotin operon repressor / biotin---[acetyl-CoA-carboxylase] ligase
MPAIIRLPETKSTNSYAIELLSKEKLPEGCVIITDNQTEGKGTDTNTWESEKGKNLTFSLVLYPTIGADQQFILNKGISLGIYDFLASELPGNKVSIKWPNDIYIADKKACGILIQNSVMGNKLDYMVIGIGLNVNQTHFTGNAPNPVSLKMITGREFDLDDLLQKLIKFVFNRYSQIKSGKGRHIETDYQKALYRLEEWHEYLVRGAIINARITGTNAFGQLELENTQGETLVCDLKEVKFII